MKTTKADIFVAGGGMAGFAAAVSAAKCGRRVILAEREISLGGLGTNGMLGEINAPSINGVNIVSETGTELIDRLISSNNAVLQRAVPMTSNPDIYVDRLRYNGEYMKFAMEEIALKYGVELCYGAEIIYVDENSHDVTVHIKNDFETVEIKCGALIDATGNAQCVFLSGGGTITTQPEKIQAPSLIFRMGGVNRQKFDTISKEDIKTIIQKGNEEGILPAKILSMLAIPGTDSIAVNCTRVKNMSGFGIDEQSQAIAEARKQIHKIVPFLKQNVPGLNNAYLSQSASVLGARDRRRIKGIFELKGEDILKGKRFDDTVSCCAYPVDIHTGNGVKFMPIENDGIGCIPLSSMLPYKSKRIIACGKCIDADDIAFGSIRVMSSMLNMGEAAGAAASQMCMPDFQEIDYNALALLLKKRNMKKV